MLLDESSAATLGLALSALSGLVQQANRDAVGSEVNFTGLFQVTLASVRCQCIHTCGGMCLAMEA